MQINGSIPFHVAKAYGMPAKPAGAAAARPNGANPAGGVQPGAATGVANGAQGVQGASSFQSLSATAGVRGADAYRPTSAARQAENLRSYEAVRTAEQIQSARGTERTDALVAARVPGEVTFSSNASALGAASMSSATSTAPSANANAAQQAYGAQRVAGNFQLYTRAADAMEAATGVMRGRAIDVSG